MDNLLNGFNGNEQVEAPPTDAGATEPTDYAKLLATLPAEALGVMERVIELLHAGEPLEQVELYAKLETARLERAKTKQEAAPTTEPDTEQEAVDPFEGDRLNFAEPETYLQPIGILARYTLAHMLMGQFGETLFGDDYLDADKFERLGSLYIDLRDGIAHGFPGIHYEDMLPTIRACENKFYI